MCGAINATIWPALALVRLLLAPVGHAAKPLGEFAQLAAYFRGLGLFDEAFDFRRHSAVTLGGRPLTTHFGSRLKKHAGRNAASLQPLKPIWIRRPNAAAQNWFPGKKIQNVAAETCPNLTRK